MAERRLPKPQEGSIPFARSKTRKPGSDGSLSFPADRA